MTGLQWDVLEELPATATKVAIEDAEQKWIDQLKPRYNASLSVKRHMLGRKFGPLSVERRQKLSEAIKGFKHTDEVKAKMRGNRNSANPTDERRRMMSENGRRRGAMGQTQATREKIRAAKTGVIPSAETLQKKSDELKGKPWSQARINAHATGKKPGAPKGKPWSEARRAAETLKYPFGRGKKGNQFIYLGLTHRIKLL